MVDGTASHPIITDKSQLNEFPFTRPGEERAGTSGSPSTPASRPEEITSGNAPQRTVWDVIIDFLTNKLSIGIREISEVGCVAWIFVSANLLYFEVQRIEEFSWFIVWQLTIKLLVLLVPFLLGGAVYWLISVIVKRDERI